MPVATAVPSVEVNQLIVPDEAVALSSTVPAAAHFPPLVVLVMEPPDTVAVVAVER